MSERLEILSSIPGIGKTTALLILVDMPEIGALDSKQVASLAGLAPMSQKLWEMAGKGADTRWPPKSATRYLHACSGRDPV